VGQCVVPGQEKGKLNEQHLKLVPPHGDFLAENELVFALLLNHSRYCGIGYVNPVDDRPLVLAMTMVKACPWFARVKPRRVLGGNRFLIRGRRYWWKSFGIDNVPVRARIVFPDAIKDREVFQSFDSIAHCNSVQLGYRFISACGILVRIEESSPKSGLSVPISSSLVGSSSLENLARRRFIGFTSSPFLSWSSWRHPSSLVLSL
jgi:hypothetical protein